MKLVVLLLLVGVVVAQEPYVNQQVEQENKASSQAGTFLQPEAIQAEGKKIVKRTAWDWDPWVSSPSLSYSLPSLPVIKTVRVSHGSSGWPSIKTLPSHGWSDPWYPSWPIIIKSNKWVDNGWTW